MAKSEILKELKYYFDNMTKFLNFVSENGNDFNGIVDKVEKKVVGSV